MILLIDNNDSFTYNVVDMLRRVVTESVVVRNSRVIDLCEVEHYSHIIFSPGPSLPTDFPIMGEILHAYDDIKPILGICLGHQAICQHYGAELVNLKRVFHGVRSEINCDPHSVLFRGVDKMIVGRYHSWACKNLPRELIVTATDSDGIIMGVEHLNKRVYGVQFHPESYITQGGEQILKNFVYGVS